MADAFSSIISVFPTQEKTHEKSPDHTGMIEISQDEIRGFVNYLQNAKIEKNWKDEPVVKIRVALWDSVAQESGRSYLKGRVSPPLEQSKAPKAEPIDF